jgi:hypothetical protein
MQIPKNIRQEECAWVQKEWRGFVIYLFGLEALFTRIPARAHLSAVLSLPDHQAAVCTIGSYSEQISFQSYSPFRVGPGKILFC